MKKILEHLRNRPHEERRHLLYLFTFLFSLILVLVWVLIFTNNYDQTTTKAKIKRDLEPFNQLKEDIININKE